MDKWNPLSLLCDCLIPPISSCLLIILHLSLLWFVHWEMLLHGVLINQRPPSLQLHIFFYLFLFFLTLNNDQTVASKGKCENISFALSMSLWQSMRQALCLLQGSIVCKSSKQLPIWAVCSFTNARALVNGVEGDTRGLSAANANVHLINIIHVLKM